MNDYFPDALAISFIACKLLVEFPETTREQYIQRLKTLPAPQSGIYGTDVLLLYHNGPLHGPDCKKPLSLNHFIDLSGSAAGQTISDKLNKVNELFWTGSSVIAWSGRRVYRTDSSGKETVVDLKLLPADGTYVYHTQGIYATPAVEGDSEPSVHVEDADSSAVIKVVRVTDMEKCLDVIEERRIERIELPVLSSRLS